MKFLIQIFLIVFVTASTSGQVWEYVSDGGEDTTDGAYDIEELSDGYIVTGGVNCFWLGFLDPYLCDVFLIKLDKEGNELWRKYLGFEKSIARAIEVTEDGGFLLGITRYLETSEGATNAEIVVVKTNSIGDIEWTKTIDNGALEYTLYSLKLTPDVGGFILTGSVSETEFDWGDPYHEAYVYKGTNSGDMEWELFYGVEENFEVFYDVAISSSGGYFLGGRVDGSLSDFLTMKVSLDGDIIWDNSFGTSGYDKATSVIELQDGNVLVAGEWDFNYNNNAKAIKLDKDTGEEIWSLDVFGLSSGSSGGFARTTTDGGFVIAANGNTQLTKFDENGNQEWANSNPISNYIVNMYNVKQTSEGGFITAGYQRNPAGNTEKDIHIVKMNSMGGLTSINDINQEDEKDNSISLYPNPAVDFLTVSVTQIEFDNVSIVIYDVLGREVKRKSLSKNKTILDLKELVSGSYFVGILSSEEEFIGGKIFRKL